MRTSTLIQAALFCLLAACSQPANPIATEDTSGRQSDVGGGRGGTRPARDGGSTPDSGRPEDDASAGDQCTEDADCAAGTFCDMGVCLAGCLDDSECEGAALCERGVCAEVACESDDDCDDANPCTDDRCGASGVCERDLAEDPVVEDSEPGDCQGLHCVDGWPAPIEDEEDVPADDGIECTVSACRSGVPTHLPDHVRCNDGDPLNGEERCVIPDGCVHSDPAWACETELDETYGPAEICDNGQDDDGDGRADEDCRCAFGSTQHCFLGPPAARGVGGCLDGQQQCVDRDTPRWSPCEGGILPGAEICDDKDNDCDGCVDDLPDCEAILECPVEDFSQPLRWYDLDGEAILGGDGTDWEWRLSAPINSATVSVEEPTAANTRVYFDVSGDYEVTVIVTDDKGTRQACTWIVHVRGDGLRVEMRWDTFGSVDMDLHLHRSRSRDRWCTDDDCYFANCRTWHDPVWGYADSPAEVCDDDTSCNNPRLDIDNIRGHDPENINLDNPRDSETFRVMAHMFSGTGVTNPIITIYCGGLARAILGEAPDGVGLTQASPTCGGQTWRVADVTMRIDGDTGVSDCDVGILGRGAWDVRIDDTRY